MRVTRWEVVKKGYTPASLSQSGMLSKVVEKGYEIAQLRANRDREGAGLAYAEGYPVQEALGAGKNGTTVISLPLLPNLLGII